VSRLTRTARKLRPHQSLTEIASLEQAQRVIQAQELADIQEGLRTFINGTVAKTYVRTVVAKKARRLTQLLEEL
jgi:hypothetical protein